MNMINFEDKAVEENDFNLLEMFKNIFEVTPNGIVVIDNNFYIKFFNEAAECMTGISKSKAVNSYFYSVFPQVLTLDIKNDSAKKNNFLIMNRKKFHTKVFSVKNKNGVDFFVYMMQDISEEIKLRVELEKSNQIANELEDILEGSFDGVLVTDAQGNVLFVNKSYERVTGITKEELRGKNMKELINPIWMKNSVVFLVIEGKSPVSLNHTTKHGKNIIVTGTPVLGTDGEINKVVVNARDITEIYDLREELKRAMEMEKLYFRNELDLAYKLDDQSGIVVTSDVMKELFGLANKISAFDTTVLILGESGVGKDVVAKYIHENSHRAKKPFIAINCGAIPEQLLESELYGYEKGAFTGASKEGKMGLFEAAEGGVLFLDEIGEMSSNLQVKLLRVLESRQIYRVGSVKPIPVNVRIITATNKDLENRIQTGEFREDLYYRINVIQLKIPPLRERIKDIAPLALYFLHNYNNKYGQNKRLTYDVITEFENYIWPGNIRQLKNIVENMVVISNNEFLQINDLPWYTKNEVENKSESGLIPNEIMHLNKAVEMVEKQLLMKAMEKYKSTRKVALEVGVDQSTVVRKLKKYGLT